ncbi:TolC family protein [Variovorax rhizosphaerae]|uniref:TolC family protein n=1 Tax=Variovorax rhizosphaerae TaxID=1836200 RepID=A0ABU8WYU2_9BURK
MQATSIRFAADRGSDVARLDLQTRRQAVRAAVATAYFDLLAVQERVRVAEAALAGVQRSARAATQRVAAGKVSPVEETKAREAEAGMRIELTQVRSEEIGARSRLATAIGQSIDGYVLDGSLDALPPMPSDETFRSKMENAPAVNRAELEVARRTALTAVENSRKFSDVMVSLGGKRNNELGLNQAVIGARPLRSASVCWRLVPRPSPWVPTCCLARRARSTLPLADSNGASSAS